MGLQRSQKTRGVARNRRQLANDWLRKVGSPDENQGVVSFRAACRAAMPNSLK